METPFGFHVSIHEGLHLTTSGSVSQAGFQSRESQCGIRKRSSNLPR
jgi:hypothetical protein